MQRSTALLSPQIDNSYSSKSMALNLALLAQISKMILLVILICGIAIGLQSTSSLRFVITGSLFLTLSLLIWNYPRIGVIGTFVYLVFLGGIRRWMIPDFGWPSYDPLVLIGATISLLSFVPLAVSRKIPSDTRLSLYIKYLLVFMAIQVINPLQGGLMVGLGGVLFYLAPLLWFYIGRIYGNTSILLLLFKFSIMVYTISGIYGMKQVVFGLSSSEKQWVKVGGYDALNVSVNAIRVFSTFASQQEYAMILSIALSLCATFFIHRKFQFLPLLLILVPALLMTGARGPIVYLVLATAVQWALNTRNRATVLPRVGVALFLGIIGLGWSLTNVDTANLSAGQNDLLRHQQDGLLNPGDSTAPDHLVLVWNGILEGFRQPLGAGLGATTLAAGKLGGGEGGVSGAEMDFGNLFISLGAVGGILYAVVIYWVFKQTSMMWWASRNIVYMALLGLVVVSFGQWLSGGLYSLCFLVWFSIGVMDREFALRNATQSAPTLISPRFNSAPYRRTSARGTTTVRSNL